jgi:hypothetical protein
MIIFTFQMTSLQKRVKGQARSAMLTGRAKLKECVLVLAIVFSLPAEESP